MLTLVLSPRYTPDSNALWQAAVRAKWPVMRLQNHRAPDELQNQDVVLYGEALFVAIIADQLDLALFETPLDWLPSLPPHFRQRDVYLTTLKGARSIATSAFIKPAADKTFDAKVYESGADLPSSEYFDDETPVLVSEPVIWEVEFRCFVGDRMVQTCSPYSRYGELAENDDGEWMASDEEIADVKQFMGQFLADDAVEFAQSRAAARRFGWRATLATPLLQTLAKLKGVVGLLSKQILPGDQASTAIIPTRFYEYCRNPV